MASWAEGNALTPEDKILRTASPSPLPSHLLTWPNDVALPSPSWDEPRHPKGTSLASSTPQAQAWKSLAFVREQEMTSLVVTRPALGIGARELGVPGILWALALLEPMDRRGRWILQNPMCLQIGCGPASFYKTSSMPFAKSSPSRACPTISLLSTEKRIFQRSCCQPLLIPTMTYNYAQ